MLVFLVLAAAGAGRWGTVWAAALAVASVFWLLTNDLMEGEVLWAVTDTHGLTAGDLAGLTGLVVAGAVVVADRLS
jgi:hypothetical protein